MYFDICKYIVRKKHDHYNFNINMERIKTVSDIRPVKFKDIQEINSNSFLGNPNYLDKSKSENEQII